MVLSALLFLSGIVLVQQFELLPAGDTLIPVILSVGLLITLKRYRLACLPLGFIWAVVFAHHHLANQLPAELEGLDVVVAGLVADLPKTDENRCRFDLKVEQGPSAIPELLRLTWYHPKQCVKAGQHWRLSIKLKRVHSVYNPGGLDYERVLFSQGIGATGYIRAPASAVLLSQADWWSLGALRQAVADRLDAQWPGEPRTTSLLKALTIGDGNSISAADWEVFRKTGTIHLMVISGSHIGLIAGLVYFIALKFWAWSGQVRLSPPKFAAATAMLAAFLYSLLAGFSIPVQRALIMLSVAFLAIISQRNTQPVHVLATALMAVLLVEPLAVLAPGFWLSFIAVFILIYLTSGRIAGNKPWLLALKLNCLTSLAMTPVLMLISPQISLIAPLANMLAVPVISLLIVPLSLLIILCVVILPPLADWLFWADQWLIMAMMQVLTSLAHWQFATVAIAQPPFWLLILALMGVFLLLAPPALPGRRLGWVLCIPALCFEPGKPAYGTVDFTLLDVGQGLATVVQTANHTLVYDTGAKFSGDGDSAKTVILPFLWQQGIDKIDALIVSHGDNDHIGGAASLLEAMAVSRILTSVPEKIPAQYFPEPCKAGQSWVWDGIEFSILSPETHFASENDNSCVLKIITPKSGLLLTGDIEKLAEFRLVEKYGKKLQTDFLIAPHHGSKTSSSLVFLQHVKPKWVLIPAGYRNQFGHPHTRVLKRYSNIGANWLTSAETGAIRINLDSSAINVESYRQTARRYWHWTN